MIEGLPAFVSPLFIATTFVTVGFLFSAIKRAGMESMQARLVVFFVPFWMLFQGAFSLGGFFANTDALPPRIFAFGVLPALLFAVFITFYGDFSRKLPLRTLTLLSVIRVPVEITLLSLYQNGQIPRAMTFEGTNFDILSGITAPIVAYLAFRNGKTNRPLLITWNVVALLLLVNVVTTAILAFPSPFQQIAFDQPNRAIIYFPFVWLPVIVVPIVFFSHLVSLRSLLTGSSPTGPIKLSPAGSV